MAFVWLPFILAVCHVFLCPFTKVEESFNMQAAHDILRVQQLDQFDHLDFPGVVPRTFIGALGLSFLASPIAVLSRVFGWMADSGLVLQYGVRIALAAVVWTAFARFVSRVKTSFGAPTALYLIFIVSVQFHFIFYSSRTLANTFAVVTVLSGVTEWMAARPQRAMAFFVISVVWFRCDMIILVGPLLLSMLATGAASFLDMLKWGIVTSAVCIAITLLVDSVFWRRWLWPEGEVLWYNTAENKSSNWGTSPWHWYLTSAIPRAMWGSVLLVPVGFMSRVSPILRLPVIPPIPPTMMPGIDRRMAPFTLPVIVFIGLYSWLPHKELRFILPAMPLLYLTAARGMHKLLMITQVRPDKEAGAGVRKVLRFVLLVAICGLLVMSAILSSVALAASSYNYPGGVALQAAHKHHASLSGSTSSNGTSSSVPSSVSIHIDVAAAETGVTRFLQRTGGWTYSKDEALTTDPAKSSPEEFADFDYLITADADFHSDGFDTVEAVEGFDRIAWKQFTVQTSPKLYVMHNKRR